MTKSNNGGPSTPLLFISGAVAAAIFAFGVNGTLSAWTSATITNSTNTAQAASAVSLSEANSAGTVCVDTTSTASNTATCASINKYGGTTTPLEPGSQQTTTVTLTNTGTGAGNLRIAAGACSKSGGLTTTESLCAYLQVSLACPSGTAIGAAATLNAWASGGARTVGNLAAGAAISCEFTVFMPTNTPPIVAGQTVSQPLTWTLTAA